eukprot:scaffold184098_cov38-Tisochrysis_lutea.AAC.2
MNCCLVLWAIVQVNAVAEQLGCAPREKGRGQVPKCPSRLGWGEMLEFTREGPRLRLVSSLFFLHCSLPGSQTMRSATSFTIVGTGNNMLLLRVGVHASC